MKQACAGARAHDDDDALFLLLMKMMLCLVLWPMCVHWWTCLHTGSSQPAVQVGARRRSSGWGKCLDVETPVAAMKDILDLHLSQASGSKSPKEFTTSLVAVLNFR